MSIFGWTFFTVIAAWVVASFGVACFLVGYRRAQNEITAQGNRIAGQARVLSAALRPSPGADVVTVPIEIARNMVCLIEAAGQIAAIQQGRLNR